MEWIDVHSGQASTREQILAACTGWVTVLLNMFTGIGNGNLYQRRWKVYWITVAVAVTLLSADAIATIRNKNHSQQIGGLGLLLTGPVSAVETDLAIKGVRERPAGRVA